MGWQEDLAALYNRIPGPPVVAGTAPLVVAGGVVSMPAATSTNDGYMTAAQAAALDGSGAVILFDQVNAALATADAPIDVNSQAITGLPEPTLPSGAATKNYADAVLAAAEAYTDAHAGGGSAYRTAVTADDVGVWLMDATSGTFANTGADGTLPLTAHGSIAYSDGGGLGDGIYLNGDPSQYLISADTTLCQPTALTVWGWVRVRKPNTKYPIVIGKKHALTGEAYIAPYADFMIELFPASEGDKWLAGANISGTFQTLVLGGGDTRFSIVTNRKHLLALTYDGTNLKAYHDGALAYTANYPGAIGYGGGPIVRGGFEGDTSYGIDGWLGEARVVNRAMSAAEIAEIYRRGCGVWA